MSQILTVSYKNSDGLPPPGLPPPGQSTSDVSRGLESRILNPVTFFFWQHHTSHRKSHLFRWESQLKIHSWWLLHSVEIVLNFICHIHHVHYQQALSSYKIKFIFIGNLVNFVMFIINKIPQILYSCEWLGKPRPKAEFALNSSLQFSTKLATSCSCLFV